MNEQYIETYNNNPDVKEYVDKYCTKHRVSVDEALTHVIVQTFITHITNNTHCTTGG